MEFIIMSIILRFAGAILSVAGLVVSASYADSSKGWKSWAATGLAVVFFVSFWLLLFVPW